MKDLGLNPPHSRTLERQVGRSDGSIVILGHDACPWPWSRGSTPWLERSGLGLTGPIRCQEPKTTYLSLFTHNWFLAPYPPWHLVRLVFSRLGGCHLHLYSLLSSRSASLIS